MCVPLLEKYSGLKFNHDFFCGYSPERINVGDKKHRLENIKKIVSGSNIYSLNKIINSLYSNIIKAGIHKGRNYQSCRGGKGNRKYTKRSKYSISERIFSYF